MVLKQCVCPTDVRPCVTDVHPTARAVNECLRPATPSAADTSKLAQALQAAGYFSKGFPAGLTNSQRPAVGAQLLRQVDSALVVAQRLRRDKDIVRRAVAFVHRMVECLGPRMLPAAARLMEVLLAPGVDAVDVCEYVGLANQLVMRFRGLVEDLMVQALPLAAARVRDLLPPDFDWAGRTSTAPPSSVAGQQMSMAALSEDRREQGEVQRCFFSSLQCLAAQGLDNVLLKVVRRMRGIDGTCGPGALGWLLHATWQRPLDSLPCRATRSGTSALRPWNWEPPSTSTLWCGGRACRRWGCWRRLGAGRTGRR